jgi:hypothetical protein
VTAQAGRKIADQRRGLSVMEKEKNGKSVGERGKQFRGILEKEGYDA